PDPRGVVLRPHGSVEPGSLQRPPVELSPSRRGEGGRAGASGTSGSRAAVAARRDAFGAPSRCFTRARRGEMLRRSREPDAGTCKEFTHVETSWTGYRTGSSYPLWMGLGCPGLHEHRGESGSVQGRLGDGHLLGGCPVHAEAAPRARRDTQDRGTD